MSFRVFENNGHWGVSQDGQGIRIEGEPISYKLYQQLRDAPHKASDHFERRDGKIVRKSLPKA